MKEEKKPAALMVVQMLTVICSVIALSPLFLLMLVVLWAFVKGYLLK